MSEHRPLPWQLDLWNSLQSARRQERLTHALLFAGAAGVGKRHFARAFAASMLCETPQADATACGACRGCTQFASGSHPNLFWLRPEQDEKTGKEKRDIGIEQLRQLSEKLALSSHYGRSRLAVLDPADALNLNGMNALLKTIEEPPPATYLLLISERPMALAATLRSRCQHLRFSCPSQTQAVAWLHAQQPDLPPSALAAAGGAPLKALDSHRCGLLQSQLQWRRDLVDVAAHKRSPIAAAAAVGRERDQAAAWFATFLGLMAELLRARITGVDVAADAAALAPRVSPAALQQMIDEAFESSRRLQLNAQPQLAVESLMISWWRWTMRTRPAAAPR